VGHIWKSRLDRPADAAPERDGDDPEEDAAADVGDGAYVRDV
jgi:hypothetical protein